MFDSLELLYKNQIVKIELMIVNKVMWLVDKPNCMLWIPALAKNANNILGWYPKSVDSEIVNSAKQLYDVGILKK